MRPDAYHNKRGAFAGLKPMHVITPPHPADEHKNNNLGNVMCKETNDCIIHGGERLIPTIGVKDLITSDTVDALLVAHKDRVQGVRTIVDVLKARSDVVDKEFPTMHRPWRIYTVLQEGAGFKLKRIEVNPGAC